MAAGTNKPQPAKAKTTFVRMSLLSISNRSSILSVPALLGGFFGVPLASASQNVAKSVVTFMARVFEELRIGGWPRIFAGPRLGPGCRVFNCKPIEQG